jgi:hypothetical protein
MKKWLYLIPVVLCLGLALTFAEIFERQKKISFEQAFQDKKDAVEIVDAIVSGYFASTNANWDTAKIFYESAMIELAEYMDSTDDIYAALYDNNLHLLSRKRGIEMQQYSDWSPFKDSVFIHNVTTKSFGRFEIDGWDKYCTVSIWFRWIVVDENIKYLFCTGITKGVVYEFENKVFYLVFSIILLTLILNFIQIYTINKSYHVEK